MVFDPFIVAFKISVVAGVTLRLNHELDGAVDNFRFTENPLTNVFATVGALLLADQTLMDANLAERVATDSCTRAYDKVHTDGTVQLVDSSKRLVDGYKDFYNVVIIRRVHSIFCTYCA